MSKPTDAELGSRVRDLSDEDVRAVAEDNEAMTGLSWYRPQALRINLAKEVLRLRAENAELRRHLTQISQRAVCRAEGTK